MRKNLVKVLSMIVIAGMIIPSFSITANAEKIKIPVWEWDAYGSKPLYYEEIDLDEVYNAPVEDNSYRAKLEKCQNKAIQTAEELKASPNKTGYKNVVIPVEKWLRLFSGGMYGDIEGQCFNSEKYAADYPDVAAAVGNSHEALWNHYKSAGIYEGRKADTTNGHYFLGHPVLDYIISTDMTNFTDRQKVIAINDWLCANYYYDYEKKGEKNPGVPQEGTIGGICQDYSDEFMWAMGYMGIPCIEDSSNAANHVWNRVYVEGQWYVVDVTWNDEGGWYRNGVHMTPNRYLLVDRHREQLSDDTEIIYVGDGPHEPLNL